MYLNGGEVKDINDFLAESNLDIRIGIVTFLPRDSDENEIFIGKPVIDTVEIIKETINNGEASWLNGILESTGAEIKLDFRDEREEISSKSYRDWVDSKGLNAIVGFVLSDHCEEIADYRGGNRGPNNTY